MILRPDELKAYMLKYYSAGESQEKIQKMIKQFEGLTLKQMDDVEYQINFCLDQMKSTDFS